MQASWRLLTFVVLGGTSTLAACGGGDLSPVASTTTFTGDNGTVTRSGRGPGAPPSPAASPGTGTCTHDCDGTSQGPGGGNGPGNGPGAGQGPGNGLCGDACTGPVGPDPADIATLLALALQGEYGAEMLYRSVLADYAAAMPFAAIVESEARHVEAVQMLFTRREMTPPASLWMPGSFPPFASVPLACAAGVVAEKEDAAFYTPYLGRTDLPQDVRNVFTNLQAASLESHLPALERCQ